MKQFSIMLKPGSAACNLRCKYCFYADLAGKRDTFSFGRMDENTVAEIVNTLRKDLEPGDKVTFAFQGGEPTLVGLDWYRNFMAQLEPWQGKIHLQFALQTNGTLLDDAWCKFLAEYRFLVGLSIDGLPRFHNDCRPDIDGRGTYPQVMEAVRLLRKYRVEFNILCTLTREIARHPRQIWDWIRENDFQYLQFTPCMDELDDPGASPYALQPKKFAAFYIQLFDLWLADFQRGSYRSIKLFDDIVNLLAYGACTACGIRGQCQCQMVVEADGSTYPCDFYCLPQYCLGNLRQDAMLKMLASEKAGAFLQRPREDSHLCSGCPYGKICGGGCRRMARQVFYGPEDTACGYRLFLDHSLPALEQIAVQQRKYRFGG